MFKFRLSKDRARYTFYDGPPFATGLPHYGHILAGTIKDIVTRWAHQNGYYVERRFGWDTHGLPVVRFEIFGRFREIFKNIFIQVRYETAFFFFFFLFRI